jgi:hypothetical protein
MNTCRFVLRAVDPLNLSMAQATVHERKVGGRGVETMIVSECFTANRLVVCLKIAFDAVPFNQFKTHR